MTTNSQLSRLSNDDPLLDPDQDRLHRRPFAEHLAQSIRSIDPSEGFVFALTGPWGSGKTTVLNFTEKLLRDHDEEGNDPIVIVHFNAWWLSGSDKLLQDFFKQFRSALNPRRIGWKAKLLKYLPPYSDPLTKYAAALVESLPYVRRLAAQFRKLNAAREADINGLRRKIDKKLKEFPGRIVVVIDDLDRLRPDEIGLVFRLVKAVANFPRTIYLLAYDEPVVIRAVGDNKAGREYLDKIVQLPLALPAPDRPSLVELFSQGLEEILADTQEPLLDWEELRRLYREGIEGFLTTPRHVARFLNLLRATYPLVQGEVNAVDFIGIQALRQFVPTMYAFIANNKATFRRTLAADAIPDEETRNELKYLENVLKSALESDWGKDHNVVEDIVRDILVKLFPSHGMAFGNSASRPFNRNNLREKCSVCSDEVFDRYFFLGVPPGALSEAEFLATMSLLPDAGAFGNKLKEFASETPANGINRARTLLERLKNAEQEVVQEEYIEPFLRVMYSIGNEIVIESDARGSSLRNDELIRRVTTKVLKQLHTQNDRFNLLQRIFLEAEALFTLAFHVHHFEQERNQNPGLEVACTIGSDHLNQLKSLVAECLRNAARDDSLRRIPFLGFVLHRYADWASDAEVEEYVSKLIQSDDGLCDFLMGFLWEEGINPEGMNRFCPALEEWVPRCKKILETSPEWLTERHREALNLYVKSVEREQAQSD